MASSLTAVCVFCGSNTGAKPVYLERAADVGRSLAERGVRLIFGGGKVGLMGAVADACLKAGGEVIGVIPEGLRTKELAHEGLTKLHVVKTMHERKSLMAELSDGFLCLPGGYGTFEEFCEVITWGQLGIHQKPCALLNVDRYYDPLIAQFQHGVAEGFIRQFHWSMLVIANEADQILDQMEQYRPPPAAKWITETDL